MINDESLNEKTETVEIGGLIYYIHMDINIAQVCGNKSTAKDIIIPQAINYAGKEYIVTDILEGAFEDSYSINSVGFSNPSNVRRIDNKAFSDSSIQSIIIPSSVVEMKSGWCTRTPKLKKVIIMPNNDYYICLDEKIVLRKSSIEKKEYDVLVFSARNVEEVTIPSFIEIIEKSAFNDCVSLQKVTFPENSKLRIIEESAFCWSSIKSIIFPSHLTRICEGAFMNCDTLEFIEFRPNSELKVIEEDAFSKTQIKSISIPPHITSIGMNAFSSCEKLREFKIPENSELVTIEREVFSRDPIESLLIPSTLIELKEGWCRVTPKLNTIKIMPGNKRYNLYDNKFIIGKSSLDLDHYDVLVFAVRNIKIAIIPDFIEIIGGMAFDECKCIQKVEISYNSKIRIFEEEAFSCSSIDKIVIPSDVTYIGKNTFAECKNLKIAKIQNNSKLEVVDKYAFCGSSIGSFFLGPKINEVGENAFSFCPHLKIIEIDENSPLPSIDFFPFNSKGLLLMVPLKLIDHVHIIDINSVYRTTYIE